MFSQLHQALTLKAASRKSKSRSPYREIDDHDAELIEACKSNYRNHQRRASSFADHHKEIKMNPNIQTLPLKEVNSRNRDTGFPEPLSNDRNTTLPHPDADTSPNATMEAPDINLVRTRSRRSFLHGRHSHSRKKSKFDSGVSLEKTAGLYDNIQYSDGSTEDRSPKEIEKEVKERDNLVDAPASTISTEKRDEQGYLEGERRKGVLRKLNLHKV